MLTSVPRNQQYPRSEAKKNQFCLSATDSVIPLLYQGEEEEYAHCTGGEKEAQREKTVKQSAQEEPAAESHSRDFLSF